MTISSLIYPCLSVFALATAAPVSAQSVSAPAEMAVETAAAPVRVAALQDAAGEEDETSGTRRAAPVSLQPDELQTEESDQADGEGDPALEAMEEPTSLTTAPGPRPVFADLSDEQVFARAVTYLQGIDTMKSRFTQISPSGNVSNGTMQLSRPGRLRFEFDAPSPILIVANQGLVYIHDSDLEDTDSYPVNKTPLKFLLSSKVDSSDARLINVTRQADSVSLTLESTDTETQGQLVLEFAAPDMALQRWSVYDPRGGVTVVDLESPQTGVRIANNAFRVPEAGGSFLRDR